MRNEEGYESLARQVFSDVTTFLRHDLPEIPYTHIIMECVNAPKAGPGPPGA